MELECELEFSSVNYYFLKIFNYCVNCKKVILTSDMYLPREVILQLLEKMKLQVLRGYIYQMRREKQS